MTDRFILGYNGRIWTDTQIASVVWYTGREADVRIGDGASVAEGARQGGRLNQIESRGTEKSKHGFLEVLCYGGLKTT